MGDFTWEFNFDCGYFTHGQNMTGTAFMQLKKTLPSAKIYLSFFGVKYLRAGKVDNVKAEQEDIESEANSNRKGKEKSFFGNDKILIADLPTGLSEGTYGIPFSYPVSAKWILPSFSKSTAEFRGEVVYFVRPLIETTEKQPIFPPWPITIAANTTPAAIDTSDTFAVKSGGIVNKGNIKVQCTCSEPLIFTGKPTFFKLNVENDSSVDVACFKIKLEKEFHLEVGDANIKEKKVIFQCVATGVPKKSQKQVEFVIPFQTQQKKRALKPSINAENSLSNKYEVTVRGDVPMCPDFSLVFPVTLNPAATKSNLSAWTQSITLLDGATK